MFPEAASVLVLLYVIGGGTRETELIKYLFQRNGTTKVINLSDGLKVILFYFMHGSPDEF